MTNDMKVYKIIQLLSNIQYNTKLLFLKFPQGGYGVTNLANTDLYN